MKGSMYKTKEGWRSCVSGKGKGTGLDGEGREGGYLFRKKTICGAIIRGERDLFSSWEGGGYLMAAH